MNIRQIFRCRGFDTAVIQNAAWIAGILFALGLAGIAIAEKPDPSRIQADRLVDQAAAAKIGGNEARAFALLHEAVSTDPNDSLARWQLGQVKVGDKWLNIEEAQRRAEADPREANYRQRREALGDSPQGQLLLARWCRANKLDDEGLIHWANVLSADPNNREALRAIGMRWFDGELKTPIQIKEDKKETGESKAAMRRWTSRVAAWTRALSDKHEATPGAILDEIRAIDDVAAIPAFEKATLPAELSSSSKVRSPAPRRLSLAFLDALKDMIRIDGTNSLMRYGVLSQFADVRAEAIAALRYRPLTDYVPTLLENLEAPIQSSVRVVNDPDGSVHYLHSMYRQGPFADWSYKSERSIFQPTSLGAMAASMMPASMNASNVINVGGNTQAGGLSEAAARQSARRYEQEITADERQIEQANQKSAALNERIFAVLTGATGQSLGSDPRPWWDWYQDYTDYYRSGDRPVYETEDRSYGYVLPPPPVQSSPRVECFARGTPVWTKTGQRSIESLQIGDLVLSQDVNTGEIRYKPVMGRTLRPAGPILQISTGDEKILATRGHPLWVDGLGWRMTKELEDGAMLQSLSGTGRIDAVKPAADAETYNLVVADFNTYFVGKSGILSHDNTPRKPTQAIVPGIKRK